MSKTDLFYQLRDKLTYFDKHLKYDCRMTDYSNYEYTMHCFYDGLLETTYMFIREYNIKASDSLFIDLDTVYNAIIRESKKFFEKD